MIQVTIDENNNIEINYIEINDNIFNQNKVNYRLVDVESEKEELMRFISECDNDRENDKYLMKEDLRQLSSIDDEYVFSNTGINEYISQSEAPSDFYDICKDILIANGMSDEDAKTLLLKCNTKLMSNSQEEALNHIFTERPHQQTDWSDLANSKIINNDNYQVCENYENYNHLSLLVEAKTLVYALDAAIKRDQDENILYNAFKADVWGSNQEWIGTFNSKNLAISKIKKQYNLTSIHNPEDSNQIDINEDCESGLYGDATFFINQAELNELEA